MRISFMYVKLRKIVTAITAYRFRFVLQKFYLLLLPCRAVNLSKLPVNFGCKDMKSNEVEHMHCLHEQSIAMIVIDAYFSLIIIVFGLGHVLVRAIIVDSDKFAYKSYFCSQFRWYIFEETALCLWTGILFISYLKADIVRAWWKAVIVIVLLITLSIALIFLLLLLLFHSYLVVTNQTTYELVRRRRIFYLRGIPERVYPFSKGVCHNLYDFCCHRSNIYNLEPLPSAQMLEERSRLYTCSDIMRCRCC
ncbi:Protein S-acyltransferase 10, partial [Cucurbita argyrosperma subsp. argyrosperma]